MRSLCLSLLVFDRLCRYLKLCVFHLVDLGCIHLGALFEMKGQAGIQAVPFLAQI